jgi:hypothetical protein
MPKVYIVNTNRSNDPNDESDMLNNEKCAAYFHPWKYFINMIEAHDLVFLYRSGGDGIIARGVATGIVEAADYHGNPTDADEEHYMYLDRFQVLETPLPPSKLKEIIDYNVVLTQTITPLPYILGIKVWQYITKNNL